MFIHNSAVQILRKSGYVCFYLIIWWAFLFCVCVCVLRMFGMVVEKIMIPEVQKVSGPVEKKICAVGITKILTECPAMMDTEYTKLW